MVALEKWNKPKKIWNNLKKIGIYAGITVCSIFLLIFVINFVKSFFCTPKPDTWVKRWGSGKLSPGFLYNWKRTIFLYVTGIGSAIGLFYLVKFLKEI
mgnify:FL=1